MNWNIIGHQNIINYLENSIINGRVSHAYLFYGPKQIGKKEVARQFIKALLCFEDKILGQFIGVSKPIYWRDDANKFAEKRQQVGLEVGLETNLEDIPCHQCEHCRELDKKIHPDLYWLEKDKEDKNISIEQIRDLRHKLAVRSFFKSYKIVVIAGAEEMSLAAANSLLKTLEEPTGRTVIILIAEKVQSLPKTILSRTQKIKFLPVRRKEIYDYLVNQRQADRDLALHISNVSAGRPGRALFFLNHPEIWQRYIQSMNTFFKLLTAKRYEKIKFSEEFLEGQKKLIARVDLLLPTLNLWQFLFRDILLLKLKISDKIINSRATEELEEISAYFETDKLSQINQQIELTKQYLRENVNPRLALENLLLEF